MLVVSVGTATASTDPYRDQAERIACPSAPPGWTHPPESEGGRSILTPLTAVAQPDDPTELFGAPVVQVTCIYRAAAEHLQVSVRYALPIDLNPWNDFYIGCTVTNHPEVVSQRIRLEQQRSRLPSHRREDVESRHVHRRSERAPANRRAPVRGGDQSDAQGGAALRARLQACRQRRARRPQVDLVLQLRRADAARGCHEQRPEQRLLRDHREPFRVALWGRSAICSPRTSGSASRAREKRGR